VGIASLLFIMLQPEPFSFTFIIDITIPQWQLGLIIGGVYAVGLAIL
jgi:hypothetical protein